MRYSLRYLTIIFVFLSLNGCSHPVNINYPKILSRGFVDNAFELSVLDLNSGKRQYLTDSRSISPTAFSRCDKTNEIVYSAYVELGEELILWAPNRNSRLLTNGNNHLRYPKWSPDCSLLSVDSNKEIPQVYLVNPTSGEMRLLLPDYDGPSMNLLWSPNLQFATVLIPIYADTKKISAYSLGIVDLSKSTLENQISGNIDNPFAYPFSEVIWAKDSTSFLFSAKRDSTFDIYRYDLELKSEKPIVQTNLDDRDPVISPDGNQFVFLQAPPDQQLSSIQLFDISSQTITELTAIPAKISAMLWLNDKQIVFSEYSQLKNKTSYLLLDISSKSATQIAEFDGMFLDSQWFLNLTSQ
jgi:Tol biopolymer transport system component